MTTTPDDLGPVGARVDLFPDEIATTGDAVGLILGNLGYWGADDNLVGTPGRVAKWLEEFAYREIDPKQILEPVFPDKFDELVSVHDIDFVALCAHHMLPFTGVAHTAYIPQPGGGVVGLSKLGRLVQAYAKQLTLQERITDQVADALDQVLNPLGCMVILQAEHGCMSLRGIRSPHARTTTSAVRGVFKDNKKHAKEEFLALLQLRERR